MAQTLEQRLEQAQKNYKDYFNKNKKHRNNWQVQERLEILKDNIARIESEILKKDLTTR